MNHQNIGIVKNGKEIIMNKKDIDVLKDRLKIRDVPNFIYSQTGVVRHKWCIYHWIQVGRRNYSNYRIKLKTETCCGQLFTRKSWVLKFLKEMEE